MTHCSNLPSIKYFLLLLFVLQFSQAHAKAEDSGQSIAMMTMELAPYGFINSKGEETGVLYELTREIITNSGIGESHGIVPVKRLLSYFDNPKGMCVIALNTPFVRSQLDAVEPIGYELTVGVLPKAGIALKKYDDLKKITIALPRGVYAGKQFMEDTSLSKAATSGYNSALLMLKSNRVDAVVGAIESLLYVAQNNTHAHQEFGKPLIFSKHDMNLFCNRHVADNIKEKLKRTVIELKESGKIQEILKRYFTLEVE